MSDILVRLTELKQELQDLRRQIPPDGIPSAAHIDAEIDAALCDVISHHSSDLMAVVSDTGVIRWVSSNAKRLFGWEPRSLVGTRIAELVHEEDHAAVPWTASEPVEAPIVYRLKMANGLYHWVESRSLAHSGMEGHEVIATRDINAHHVAQSKASEVSALFADELERMAHTDSLTMLPNRRSIEKMLDRELSRSTRSGTPVSVVFFDIDRFKAINDTFGHVRGDEVLRAVGQRMASTLRPYDFIGRWGGDEFLVILPDTDAEHAVAAARRLSTCLSEEEVDGVGAVTVSGGVAQYAGEAETSLVDRADKALYRAKVVGRNRIECS